jgi:hypothetical protein
MGSRPRRAGIGAALPLLLAAPCAALLPAPASAQDDEVIVDPELAGQGAGHAAQEGDEQVIVDPELAAPAAAQGEPVDPSENFGWGKVLSKREPPPVQMTPVPASEEEAYDPLANTGIAKLELLAQFASDMRHEYALEDVYETRIRFGGEIEFRRSRNLRLVLGSRVDFYWAVPSQNDPAVVRKNERALDEDRYEVDVLPTAAYADATLADGFHMRVGHQVVSLGRMDFYSPTDVLVAYDMRPQPKLDLTGNKLAQPAVRIDWDASSWLTLQAIYVPWFMPHLSRPNRDQYVSSVLIGRGASLTPDYLNGLIDPSYQTKQSEANLRFVGPPPDFRNPQAQLRMNLRASSMELALSAGTAVDKLPMVYTTPRLDAYLRDPRGDATITALGTAVRAGQSVADVEYHRYYLLGLDGSFDISPISIGFEFAYSPSRHMYAATRDGSHVVQPNVSQPITDAEAMDVPGETGDASVVWKPSNVTNRKIRKGVPVLQGALHVEWVKGESFVLMAETFWINALELPYDKTRDWWGFIPKTGAYVGGFMAMSYLLQDGKYRFDVSAVTGVGPSIALLPGIEVRAKEGLYLNVSAQIFEGPAPGFNGAQNLNFGGLLSGYDQVALGLRWLP